MDSQHVYTDLLNHATASTSATLEVSCLHKTVVNATLDSTWHGTTVGFLDWWMEQVRLLEDITDLSEHYSEDFGISGFGNFVFGNFLVFGMQNSCGVWNLALAMVLRIFVLHAHTSRMPDSFSLPTTDSLNSANTTSPWKIVMHLTMSFHHPQDTPGWPSCPCSSTRRCSYSYWPCYFPYRQSY